MVWLSEPCTIVSRNGLALRSDGVLIDTPDLLVGPVEDGWTASPWGYANRPRHLARVDSTSSQERRVSRLSANIAFIQRNLSPLSFIDGPRACSTLWVYELNRVGLLQDVFPWAYERSAAPLPRCPAVTGQV